jgi:ATP-dependent exoDNAse (exonuclease V) alpha subunit
MPKLEGSVENIVFRNEENHYVVARFRLNDNGRLFRDELATIVGILPGIHTGELLAVEGEWESDPRYGRQLRVTSFVQRLPASSEGIIRYLSSGLIKGIGPKKAKLIVDHFGEQTLAIIEQQPDLLSQVKGISVKDRDQIAKTWVEQADIKELHLFMQSHDVSMSIATRVYKQYGKESIRVIRENPYQLAQDVQGIGFRTADDIALKLGLPHDSIPRLATGMKFVLTQAANEDGHCFLLEQDLLDRASDILHAPTGILQAAMEQLRNDKDVFVEPSVVAKQGRSLSDVVSFDVQYVVNEPVEPQTGAVGQGLVGSQTEAVGQGLVEPQTGAVGQGLVGSQTEAVGQGLVGSQTEAVGQGLVGSQTEAVGQGLVGSQTGAVGTGLAPVHVPTAPDSVPPVEIAVEGEAIVPPAEEEPQSRIYFGPFWYAESGSARLLRRLQKSPSSLPPTSQQLWERVFMLLKEKRNMILAEKQREAVQMAYSEKVSILTGGPGTGKSTSIRALIMLLRTRKVDVALAAPTGRAAKRLTETTGVQAKTLHRLLEYAPHDNSYQRNEDNPLPYQFLIVDEFSMVDILLFYHLLKALPRESHLLLVGDADQLPSVGPGNVLRDLLQSAALPTVRLTELFRQARQSKIIVNAHRINAGQMPVTKIEQTSDFFFMAEEDPVKAQQLILDLVQRRLPAKYHFDPITDIQVLSPMYKGAVGVKMLNERLQAQLNPHSVAQVEWADRILRVGDKVMQTKNDYDKGVFNGDVGFIRRIDKENATVRVEFLEEAGPLSVSYEFKELDDLVLAYAVTVHKSQGSEYPVIILPLFREHRLLLQRNLLYTAITRAKRFCVLVGQPQALEIAVHNNRVAWRNTALMERLLQLSQGQYQVVPAP